MALVSVLMSLFNESVEEIRAAIYSILQQTYKDLELIIINDNPKEKRYETIVESIVNNDNRVKYYSNKNNIGLAMSMNYAASIANGKYLVRMDADDVADLNRIEKNVEILDTEKYDLVFGDYDLINEMGQLIGKHPPTKIENKDDILEKIVFDSFIHHPTVTMTKEIFNKTGGYRDFPCSQDQDLWIRMIEHNCRFYYIDNVLLHYRIRNNSITQQKSYKQMLTILYIKLLLLERIKKGHDSFSRENYESYITSHDTPIKKKNYEKARAYLIEASKNTGIQRVLLRVNAFLLCKEYRENYCIKWFYKKACLEYFNAIKN